MDITNTLPVKCLHCANCGTVTDTKLPVSLLLPYPNKATFQCNQCSYRWDVCIVHCLRFRYDSYAQKHFQNCIRNVLPVVNTVLPPIAIPTLATVMPMFSALPVTSQNYFNEEASHPGSGLQGIIARAFSKNASNCVTTTTEEVIWHMKMM